MRENEIAVIGGAGFLGARPATRFNEADTNYTICDINVANRSSKIVYINIEDKDFLTQLAGANSINLAATLLYGTPLFIRHLESAYSTMYDRYQQGLDPEHIYVEHV